jgi:uncharacterized membrane protein HdeD (DUF308 family)
MISDISRNWWMAVLRGALAVLFGVVALVWPGITFEALVLVFGVYAFFDGVLVLGFGLMAAGDGEQWWPLVLAGILGIAIGVITFFKPQTVGLSLVYVIGAWAIITGLLQIVAAIRLREIITTEWLLGLTGVLSVVFGVLVVAQPNAGAISLVYLFGLYAILVGIAQIAFGFRVRNIADSLPRVQTVPSTSTSH